MGSLSPHVAFTSVKLEGEMSASAWVNYYWYVVVILTLAATATFIGVLVLTIKKCRKQKGNDENTSAGCLKISSN